MLLPTVFVLSLTKLAMFKCMENWMYLLLLACIRETWKRWRLLLMVCILCIIILLIYASSLPFTNVKVQLLYILHLLQTSNETIELPDGTADTVYQELLLILDKYHVPLGKVIGICADGASTMQGVYRGVCIRLGRHLRQLRQEVCDEITAGDITRTPYRLIIPLYTHTTKHFYKCQT